LGGVSGQGAAGAGGAPLDAPVEAGGNSGTPNIEPSGGGRGGSAPIEAGGSSGEAGAGGSVGGSAGAASSAGGTGTGTDCQGGKVVHFVYFVEADTPYSEEQHADIEAQAYAFQQYWYEQLGVTFYLSDPVVDVIEAEHESSWYIDTPDGVHTDERWYRLGNVKNEVHEKLGIRDFDPSHRVVNYPTTRWDGRVGGNFGGAWMDGDDLTCQAEEGGVNYPYDDGSAAHCLGHVVHEFGHVLGLDHEGPQDDCMQYGFYVSYTAGEMCTFSPENVAKILADPDNEGWFEAEPGASCRGE
jgi:hypothetical protein